MILEHKLYIKKLEHFPDCVDGINYATEFSSGIDLVAAIDDEIVLKPMQRILVPTGISIAFDNQIFEAQIRSRSGLAFKNGIVVLNSPGTIDNDYRGEIKVLLINFSNEDFKITKAMRIAQMVIIKFERVKIEYLKNFESDQKTQRDCGGFGSTGLHYNKDKDSLNKK
jgi:dUTP pyrophosphatase